MTISNCLPSCVELQLSSQYSQTKAATNHSPAATKLPAAVLTADVTVADSLATLQVYLDLVVQVQNEVIPVLQTALQSCLHGFCLISLPD